MEVSLFKLTSSAKNRSCSLKESILFMQVRRWSQPFKLTSSAKNRSCSLRNQFYSCKSVDGSQPFKLTSSAKNRSCSLKESILLMQVRRWKSAVQIGELCQKQVMQYRNQFNSGHSTRSPIAHFDDLIILLRPYSPKARSS